MQNTLFKAARKRVQVPPLPPPKPEPECRVVRQPTLVPEYDYTSTGKYLGANSDGRGMYEAERTQTGWTQGYRLVRVCKVPPTPPIVAPVVAPVPDRWDATARSIEDGSSAFAVEWTVYQGNRDVIAGLSRITEEPAADAAAYGGEEEMSKALRSAVMQGFRASGNSLYIHEVAPQHYAHDKGYARTLRNYSTIAAAGARCRIEHRPTSVSYFVDGVLVAIGPSFALRGETLHLRAALYGVDDLVDGPAFAPLETVAAGAVMLPPLVSLGGLRAEGRVLFAPLFVTGPERRQGAVMLAPLQAYAAARESTADLALPPLFVWGWGHIGNSARAVVMLPPLAIKGGEPGAVARVLLPPIGLFGRGSERAPMLFAKAGVGAGWSVSLRGGNNAISQAVVGVGAQFTPGVVRHRNAPFKTSLRSQTKVNQLWGVVYRAITQVAAQHPAQKIIDAQVSYRPAVGGALLTLTVLSAEVRAGVEVGSTAELARLADAAFRASSGVRDTFWSVGEFNRALRTLLAVTTGGGALRGGGGQRATWCILPDGASTAYDGFEFSSFARIGDAVYAAGEDGLYELVGDDDDGRPIEARIALGQRNFGSSSLKYISHAYLGVGSDGQLTVAVRLADGTAYQYAARRSDPHMRTQRVDFGRGLRATYFDLELRNQAGGDFELDAVEVNIAESVRRV